MTKFKFVKVSPCKWYKFFLQLINKLSSPLALTSYKLQALKQLPREKIQLATKFGIVETNASQIIIKGSPQYTRSCCEASLKRLDVDYIDLYYIHRIDTTIPIEETVSTSIYLVKMISILISCVMKLFSFWLAFVLLKCFLFRYQYVSLLLV